MSLNYVIREGLAGFSRAKLASFASISAMTVALALIGLFILLGFQAQQVSTWLKQRVGEIDVFLTEVDTQTGREVRDQIVSKTGIETATYISKERAAQIFRRDFGRDAELFIEDGQTFLPASVKVTIRPEYTEPEMLRKTAETLKKLPNVSEVVYNYPALVAVQENLRLISLVGIIIGIVVALAALFLVGNTIRLTIYARRLLIRTMKLVGATDRFVQTPFLVEGMVQGLLAGLSGGFLLIVLYEILKQFIPQLADQPWPGGSPIVLFLILILFGVMLGLVGSLFAVRRFVKNITLS
jgi:cell division transport system permease protein